MSALEETETLAALFLLPENIAVKTVYPTKSRLTLQISCTLKSASCPFANNHQNDSQKVWPNSG
jgi:hypothetical protein